LKEANTLHMSHEQLIYQINQDGAECNIMITDPQSLHESKPISQKLRAIIDTGAELTFIPSSEGHGFRCRRENQEMIGASGDFECETRLVDIYIGNFTIRDVIVGLIDDNYCDHCLLGRDVLSQIPKVVFEGKSQQWKINCSGCVLC
jgi:gag-polyprotein putative aspartyl protease